MYMYDENADKKTVLIVGAGKLGGPVLDALALRWPRNHYIVASRSQKRSQDRANLTKYIAAQWNEFPSVTGINLDIENIDDTSEVLSKYQPDVVFNATTPFPWWKIDLLPQNVRDSCNLSGPGIWCALDCLLPYCLTKALDQTSLTPIHVNACYPDLTNAFLRGHRNAPIFGIGNISNLVPGLQLAFAEHLGQPPSTVKVRIFGHHFVSWNAPTLSGCQNGAYYLSIDHPDGTLYFSGPDDTPFQILRRYATRVRGLDGLSVTIGSAVTLLNELLGGRPTLHHSPGACGLPGGYPIRISREKTPVIDLPDGLSIESAVDTNARSQTGDGIYSVTSGLVRLTQPARETYRLITNTTFDELNYTNLLPLSEFLRTRLRAFVDI